MAITHDRALDVALGNNRKTKTWKNKSMLWSDLLARLERVTRTPETMAEYKAMSRDRQSEIKDVGGFVGGYCNEGRRTDVSHRSVLCLDADFADADLWPDWGLLYGNAAAAYSTHKHTADKPRLRLVVPLARDVSPDEYQAIGRRVAATLGIDKFDDTTYQPQRVMYWPSCSQDGVYYFKSLDAPLLDPDEVLATYHNWTDVSSWPMSSRVADIAKRSASKQQDPLEKSGLVGAFCRAYTISEAVAEYVKDYVPCDEPGRFTYAGGSTAAGVVVYDDKFSYSHHATDPASGQLVNAWDLVRLHQFADLDTDIDPETKASQRPSYKAMSQLAAEDGRVKSQLVADRTAQAAADFAEDAAELPDPDDGSWREKLKITEKGTVAQTIANVVTILEHDPKLANVLAYDEMQCNIMALGPLPWEKRSPRQWIDADDSALRYYLEHAYGIGGKDKIFDAVNVVAKRNAFHPVRDYLEGCTWDGVPRVETLLVDYLGAEDCAYTRAVTRKTLTAAVARIYRPGCKFDHMLTLRGAQGLGKSSLIAKLAGQWFSDSFTSVQGKEAYEQVQGVWIMEVGELAGMKKAEVEAIKLYISKQSDRFRPAYGRRLQEFPRQCVFMGSTNESQFLRDTTGNRRFWVVDTPNTPERSIWDDLTPETVRLIWGEAVELFRKGEPLYLTGELEAEARDVQAAYEEENPKAGIIADYLDRQLPEDWENMDTYSRRQWLETNAEGTQTRESVTTLEIWAEALGGNPDKLDRYAAKEIRDIMAGLPDWRHCGNKKKTARPYGRQRYYERRTQ
ncbi:MAG: virulence-associated E family protein [Alistipes sp.]|nr:virulence-associated E family protein [Alistipes sp.]